MIQSLPTQTKCVDLKRQGLAKVEHKPPICEEDLKKLYESTAFGLDDPEKLQNKVFFEVMLYFCRRGRQNLRQLKKTNFSFNTDSTGARYVCKATGESQAPQAQNTWCIRQLLLDKIENVIQRANCYSTENQDKDLLLYQDVKDAIHHQIQTVRQGQARLDVLDCVDEKSCLITNGWTMTFSPQRYRETQSGGYDKCGIS